MSVPPGFAPPPQSPYQKEPRRKKQRVFTLPRLIILGVVLAILGGAVVGFSALFGKQVSDLNSMLNGRAATMRTFDEQGFLIDQIKGKSFDVRRDETFDSAGEDGSSNADSKVLMISLGSDVITHVGSTMVLADDGVVQVSGAPTRVALENTQSGTPWLNYMHNSFGNLWQGKAKTIMVRSQSGMPIAVYAGNHVETFATDIPQSTWLRVDDQNLLIYRADLTIIPTNLLSS